MMPVLPAAALNVALAGPPAAAPAYTVTTIAGLQDLAGTGARGINLAGEIVGVDGATEAFPPCNQAGEDSAFTDVKGTISEFVIFTGCYAVGQGVSSNGTVVGYAAPPSNAIEGFIRAPGGTITGVTYPGAFYTRLSGINANGSVSVGSEYDGSNFHGLIDKAGTLTTYDVPNSPGWTVVNGVNDAGNLVGWFSAHVCCGAGLHGYAVIGGTFKQIDYPNAAGTNATGINDHNEIVGSYVDTANVFHGFILTPKGKFLSFDVPGATSTHLNSVNNRGVLVGGYSTSASASFAFTAVRKK